MNYLFSLFLIGILSADYPTQKPQLRPFTPVDLASVVSVGAGLPSPNGKSIFYSKAEYSPKTNKKPTEYYLMDVDSKQSVSHTASINGTAPGATWISDTQLAFVSKSAIFVYDVAKKTAPQLLVNITYPISSFKYNAPTNRIVAAAYIDSPDPDKKFDTALVYETLMVRHWDHFVKRGLTQLFSVQLSKDASSATGLAQTGTPVNLLKNTQLESPVDYTGGPNDYQISPDGSIVAFGAKKPGVDQAWQTEQNIYLVPIDGSAAPQDLTLDNQGAATQPTFSKDGKTLSWLQMNTPKYESDKNSIVVYDLKTKAKKFLVPEWDRSPASLLFTEDSSKLIVTAQETARTKIFSIDVASGKIQTLTKDRAASGVSLLGKDGLVFSISSIAYPNDIYTAKLDGSDFTQLTKANEEKFKGIYLADVEDFWFQGALNDKVHALLLKPIDFDPKKKYPISLIIHGGPQSAYQDRWSTNHNFNVHAGAGRVVLAVNFHGSTGFGQNFTNTIRDNWGTYPFEDLMKGLDSLISQNSWADGSRTCSVGTSYGGYMGNWINGHTDRFKCIVMANGKMDTYHTYFSTDELWFPEYDFKGTPMENEASYRKWSPDTYIKNWKTPTLVVQGQNDYRIVDGEALGAFTVLQRKGIPSRLLYFPDEGHGVNGPANLIRFMNETIEWTRRFAS